MLPRSWLGLITVPRTDVITREHGARPCDVIDREELPPQSPNVQTRGSGRLSAEDPFRVVVNGAKRQRQLALERRIGLRSQRTLRAQ